MTDIKHAELKQLEAKMVNACQNRAMKAWRKYGKQIYRLRTELNLDLPPWLEETFGRIV